MKKHLRKTICLLAVLTLLVASTAVSFAAEDTGVVSYEGQVEKFLFEPGSDYSKTDLFGKDYKGVMPGDVLTDTVTVRNNASDKVNVEIFMKALGASDLQNPEDGIAEVTVEESYELLKEMHLTVVHENGNVIFDAAASEAYPEDGFISLGKFKSGEEVDLTVTLTFPIDKGDEFASKIGALDWQFKVNEYEITEPTEPTEEPIKETKTGDDMNLIVPIALMGAAALILIILLATRRRKQEQ